MAGRNLFSQAQSQFNRVHHNLGSSPLICWFLGVLVLVLWLSGTVIQIQTSEYLAMGGSLKVAGVAWAVLVQPYLMVTGQAPVIYATAWMYGWVVEVVTLVFALALSVAVRKISIANPKLGKGFMIFGFLLIALNSWADFTSSPGTTLLVQGLIALAIGIIVVCGLPLGIGLIEHGFDEL
jgi:hypothetical protein